MHIYDLKFSSSVQAILYCRYCNRHGIKATSSVLAAAIGVDSTVLRITMVSLNSLHYTETKPGPGGMKVNESKMNTTLLKLFDDLNNEEKKRKIFSMYETYNDGNKAMNSINRSLSSFFRQSENTVFKSFEKMTLLDLYEKSFGKD